MKQILFLLNYIKRGRGAKAVCSVEENKVEFYAVK